MWNPHGPNVLWPCISCGSAKRFTWGLDELPGQVWQVISAGIDNVPQWWFYPEQPETLIVLLLAKTVLTTVTKSSRNSGSRRYQKLIRGQLRSLKVSWPCSASSPLLVHTLLIHHSRAWDPSSVSTICLCTTARPHLALRRPGKKGRWRDCAAQCAENKDSCWPQAWPC